MDVVWKVVEAVIDTRTKTVVQFHDVLHGFCAEKVMGEKSWSSKYHSSGQVWIKTPYSQYSLT